MKENLITENSNDIECKNNQDDSYKLCYTKVDKNDPLNVDYLIKFSVMDMSNDEIIYNGSVVGGYVQWKNSNQIEYYSPPGIVEEGKSINDYIKIYDLNSKKERIKSSITNYKK